LSGSWIKISQNQIRENGSGTADYIGFWTLRGQILPIVVYFTDSKNYF